MRQYPMPQRYELRFAQPAEAPVVAELLSLAGVELEQQAIDYLNDGISGEGLRRSVEFGPRAMIGYVEQSLAESNGLLKVLASQSSFIVAVDASKAIHGAIYMLPPGSVLASIPNLPLPQLVKTMLSLVRIKAVAVGLRVRRRGLGRALIEGGLQLYRDAGYSVAYGSFHDHLSLAPFYDKCGFTVLSLNQPLPLEPLLGIRAGVQPGPGERIFVGLLQKS